MKKILTTMALVLGLVFVCTGCSLFSDDSVVKFDDTHSHKDPKDLKYDERVVLSGEDFGSDLEDMVNQMAYPDTMMYDADGNMTGMYDYDAETGLAKGWTNIEDGTYTAYAEGEEVDLGKPDESQMITIPGTVTAGFVVYGNKGSAVAAYMYFYLSDASAKDVVKKAMEDTYGLTLTEESDTVLTCVQDEAYIADQFAQQEEAYGEAVETKDASAYADILKMTYGVKVYAGKNAYKPYADHTDPTDIEFDKRVVLTGPATAAVLEENADDVTAMTEYIYGKDGNVVADYTYIECASKESADKLMDTKDKWNNNAVRVSDTVIQTVVSGKDMDDLVTAYIGYNVMKDKSLDEYVRMAEETYFTTVCEE